MMVGAGAGTAVGTAATAVAVPVIQAVGFTSSGIAAGSTAAGMMSSAAIAGGGCTSSGSAVAVLQSVGATSAVPLGIAAAAVGSATVVGLGVAGIVLTCRSFQHEYISAYKPRDEKDAGILYWLVATEEGVDNVRVCRYASEHGARAAFDNIWCCRVLYNPSGEEVECRGWNGWALATVRRVMKEKYLTG
ncbi:hypothetical protein BBJ29_001073 [Phytophthora kernoviae]|uniref:Uncharacterized protein n=1 Tax=Phytophthora kernoviae TaxID=325452 RepID=A0A421FV65_9STRA|nr:hypothetical protein BBJ29_001073 [Phytophthora kernoviae]